MQRILVINSKGGCGKTTIATNLAGFYASMGTAASLLDYDPQGSSARWLELRPQTRSPIHGVFAGKPLPAGVTRSFAFRVPPETERIIVDTPASMKRLEMIDLLRGATAAIVPVLPSAIDRHVTLDFLDTLSVLCRQAAPGLAVGVVANRVRHNTRAFKQLRNTLKEKNIPLATCLRDTQNYVQAAEEGCSVIELNGRSLESDWTQWCTLVDWLEPGWVEMNVVAPAQQNDGVIGKPIYRAM